MTQTDNQNMINPIHLLESLRKQEFLKGREGVNADVAKVLAIVPNHPEPLIAVANALAGQQRFVEALALCKRAADAGALTPEQRLIVGQIHFDARHPREAIMIFEAILKQTPNDPTVLLALGKAQASVGETAVARRSYEAAMKATPSVASRALQGIVQLNRVAAGDEVVRQLDAAIQNRAGLEPMGQARIYYAMGKACDDMGDVQRAMSAFSAGAEIMRTLVTFNEADTIRAHQSAERAFAGRVVFGGMTPPPAIFIVGMPRTGTTMTEQLLLGDQRVGSIGETRAFLESSWPWLGTTDPATAPSADLHALFTKERLAIVQRNYAQRVREYQLPADKTILLDKTTPNYVWAPLAASALAARIVHCVRDPIDTCLSIYTTWFGRGTPWSYDLGAIARAYGRYHRHMEKWREVLSDAVIELPYEKLVASPQDVSRTLYAHCGLNWTPDVLNFAGRGETVVTPSQAQVRHPISDQAVGRSKAYGKALDPLREALQREGVSSF